MPGCRSYMEVNVHMTCSPILDKVWMILAVMILAVDNHEPLE